MQPQTDQAAGMRENGNSAGADRKDRQNRKRLNRWYVSNEPNEKLWTAEPCTEVSNTSTN